MMMLMKEPSKIFGIDFSGAKDAGNKIWIAEGVPRDNVLLIEECFQARHLPNSGRELEACLPALVNLIKSNRNAAFGFDFPFGLPAPFVTEKTWEEFIFHFLELCQNPKAFRESCRQVSKRPEIKRKTDLESRTPFSPYNLRLYKQTYYGISMILLPLVRDGGFCILPFHKPIAGKPWVFEICPASTLTALGIHGIPYKGRDDIRRNNRQKILKAIERNRPIVIQNSDITHRIIEDKGGDALDSVIAAMATFNALKNKDSLIPDDNGFWEIEGYVFI